MENHLGSMAGHEVNQLGRADVHLVHRQLVTGRRPGVGQIGQRSGGQVVDHIHGLSFSQETVHQRRTDEAGSPGYQHAHRSGPRFDSLAVDDRA